MKRLLYFLALTIVATGFQNCSPYHEGTITDSSISGLQVDQDLQNKSLTILTNKCAKCHDSANSGGVTQILNVDHLISSGLITIGDPTKGRLIGAIEDGSMPVGGVVVPTELQTLKDWIASMRLPAGATAPPPTAGGTPPPAGAPPATPLPSGVTLQADATLQKQALAVISTSCASCHDTSASGGVTKILDVNNLVATGLVIPGDPTKGRLVGSIADGSMPLVGIVTPADLNTIKNWISSIKVVGGTLPPVAAPQPLLPDGKTVIADAAKHNAALQVLNVNCAGCHQGATSGGIGTILDINSLVRSGLVTPGDRVAGRLLGSIADRTMPKGPGIAISTTDVTKLKDWIGSMQIVDDGPLVAKMGQRVAIAPTFTAVFANVIQPKCVRCHLAQKPGIPLNTYASLKANLSGSLQQCQSGSMPRTPYPKLTADELAKFREWSNAGALNN